MVQQVARVARVFARNEVNILQDTNGAVCHIVEVSDRSRDNV
jgi:hypothetical protein